MIRGKNRTGTIQLMKILIQYTGKISYLTVMTLLNSVITITWSANCSLS